LKSLIGDAQARLTDELADVVKYGQERGWLREDMTARAIAVLMQVLVFGRTLEDISSSPIEESEWGAAMSVVFSEVLKYPPEYGTA
jgi:hypothetical protein